MKILGVNKRSYPKEGATRFEEYTNLKVVLVAGDIGDYAAYSGDGSDEWVAKNGDKLSFEEACAHFPGGQLKEERYRL